MGAGKGPPKGDGERVGREVRGWVAKRKVHRLVQHLDGEWLVAPQEQVRGSLWRKDGGKHVSKCVKCMGERRE